MYNINWQNIDFFDSYILIQSVNQLISKTIKATAKSWPAH